jgi:FOG: TPR repeat, SEL1 subfamily
MKVRIVVPLVLMGLFSVGSACAMTNTQAEQLTLAAYNKGNTTDLAKLESAAKSGDAAAQMWLGWYLAAVNKDYAEANAWFERAAAQGNAAAEVDLGKAYSSGHGVPQNYARANSWFEKAAAQGSVEAEYNLGNAYFFGHGVPQNYAKADSWYEKAAAPGFAMAEYNLGVAYYLRPTGLTGQNAPFCPVSVFLIIANGLILLTPSKPQNRV